jgi:hypothetical protein
MEALAVILCRIKFYLGMTRTFYSAWALLKTKSNSHYGYRSSYIFKFCMFFVRISLIKPTTHTVYGVLTKLW